MCWKCVYTSILKSYKSTQCFCLIPILKSPFSNQAVLRFLSEWRSSVQPPPPPRPSYLRPPEWAESCPPPVQGKTRCLRLNDWGVLIMNIAVVFYSRHLSSWRPRGLTSFSFWRECADPQSTWIHLCSPESFMIQLYRSSEYKGFMNLCVLCKSPFLIMG